MANDIALMKVTPRFNFNVNVQPATIATKDFVVPSTTIVAGWGYTKEGGGLPNILQKVTVPVVPNAQCRKDYSNLGWMITDSTICAGAAGKDSCNKKTFLIPSILFLFMYCELHFSYEYV